MAVEAQGAIQVKDDFTALGQVGEEEVVEVTGLTAEIPAGKIEEQLFAILARSGLKPDSLPV